jgi:Uma2 family endonuclease
MARPPVTETETAIWIALNIQSVCLTDDQFIRLCSGNADFRFEISPQKELIIMPGTGPKTDNKNAEITGQLWRWTKEDGSGVCFGSSAIFILPNGARRIPDGAWIPKNRWDNVSRETKSELIAICPDFLIELRSSSDRLPLLEAKMEEYIENGARLAWLLDPIDNCATIYSPGHARQRIENPAIISGDPVLPRFNFDFREIL